MFYVKPENQTLRVLRWLSRVGPLDPLTALRKLGIYRLGARIYDLRLDGVDIRTDYKRTRGGARVAVYSLVRG